MKTKYWVALLAAIVALCAGLSIPLLFPGEDARFAELISDGKTIATLDLGIDQELTVDAPNGGSNTVTVKDGKIGVTCATCPDHYCMDRGMCSRGAEIVCLPNRLVIRFLGAQDVDTVVG